jgi:hypothetical protein
VVTLRPGEASKADGQAAIEAHLREDRYPAKPGATNPMSIGLSGSERQVKIQSARLFST